MHTFDDLHNRTGTRAATDTRHTVQARPFPGSGSMQTHPKAAAEGSIAQMLNNSPQVQRITHMQTRANTTPRAGVLQKQGDETPGMGSGFLKGLKTATLDRFKMPQMSLGSGFSYSLMGSMLLAPFLSDAPSVPSTYRPYVAGFGGGFIGGTLGRKLLLNRMRVPGIIDTLMTINSLNDTALKIDQFVEENPQAKIVGKAFTDKVFTAAREQHARTNPYMNPTDPESLMEIQSNG